MISGIYFSGTGNSRHCVARFLEECGITDPPVSIEDTSVLQTIAQSDTIVFACPIYYSNIPLIVRHFIEREANVFTGRNVFVIATMGLFSGDGSGCAARVMKKHGAHIIGGLHVTMPDCICDERVLKKSDNEIRKIIEKADIKIAAAARSYLDGIPPQEGLGFLSRIGGLLSQRLWFGGMTAKYSHKLRINAALCIGCGICADLCPMGNIGMDNGKAAPRGQCTLCYRRANSCPKQAITLLGKRVHQQYLFRQYVK